MDGPGLLFPEQGGASSLRSFILATVTVGFVPIQLPCTCLSPEANRIWSCEDSDPLARSWGWGIEDACSPFQFWNSHCCKGPWAEPNTGPFADLCLLHGLGRSGVFSNRLAGKRPWESAATPQSSSKTPWT